MTTTLEDFLNLPSPNANHAHFTPITGSPEASIFLSQMIYWTGKQKNKDGWIYKTQEEWQNEVELTIEQQNGAREKLKQAKFLEEKFMGMPRKLYYRLNIEHLRQKWDEWMPSHQVKEAIGMLSRRYQFLKSQGNNTDLVSTYLTRCRTVLAQARKDPKTAKPFAESLIREIPVYCSGKTPFIDPGKSGLLIQGNPDSLSGVLPSGSLYTEITYRDYEQKENTPYIPQVQHPDFGGGEEERKEWQNANLQEAELQRVIATNSFFPDQNSGSSTQTDILIRGGSSAAAPQNPTATKVINPPQSQETGNLSKSTPPTPQAAKKPRKMNEAEIADLVAQLNLTGEPLTGQHFAYRLLPWEINAGPNGLDSKFCQWLAKALSNTSSAYQGGCSLGQAKQWLKQARFQLPRLDAVYCRWVEYQESITKKQQIEQQQIEQQSTQTRSRSRWDSDEFMSRERLQQKAKELLESGIIKKVAA